MIVFRASFRTSRRVPGSAAQQSKQSYLSLLRLVPTPLAVSIHRHIFTGSGCG